MRLWIGALLLVAGCAGDDISDPDPGPDASSDESICGQMPVTCDFDGPDCPALEEVCDGVCGAAAECCTCDPASATWEMTSYDCAPCDHPDENPVIEPGPSPECETDERMVRDVCTELGPDDGCQDVDDVCVELCDPSAAACDGELRLEPLVAFPTAPGGYCICCAEPGEPC